LLKHPKIITDPPPNFTVDARPRDPYKPQYLIPTVTFLIYSNNLGNSNRGEEGDE
jgi:hypothetical protein